ncbi:hypothetical protein [Rhabdothermincola salaria]|uniref:hypothetical protein n=1 Tax=Rhabdothermincola salaria TaxID=2903142 RepID=UPI001E2A948A|nr:hypothetical protein [Rhabdothermincola salaria]MCD9623952.1 hypothetical protein [Rhabdothermincola salaria]
MSAERARSILAVAPDAGPDEIEAAFRRAIRTAHPDHGGDVHRSQDLLDARRCLRHHGAHRPRSGPGPGPAVAYQRIVIVPAARWRDLLAALIERVRHGPARPPPRVR